MLRIKLAVIAFIFSMSCIYMYSQDERLGGTLLPDFMSLLGNWNPSDIGPDSPDKEEYNWFIRKIDGTSYNGTSGDVYFTKRNNKIIFVGDGGLLVIDEVKKIRQRLILKVHSEIGKGNDVSGEVRLMKIDNDHFCFTFAMPPQWREYFGSENVIYTRAKSFKD